MTSQEQNTEAPTTGKPPHSPDEWGEREKGATALIIAAYNKFLEEESMLALSALKEAIFHFASVHGWTPPARASEASGPANAIADPAREETS